MPLEDNPVLSSHHQTYRAPLALRAATPLEARELKSRLRFQLPEKWSNDLQYEFSMLVGNDDRDIRMGNTDNPIEIKWMVRPQSIAEEPVLWVNTDLSMSYSDIGLSVNGNLVGVKALGMADVDATGNSLYVSPGPSLNIDQNGAMSEVTVWGSHELKNRQL